MIGNGESMDIILKLKEELNVEKWQVEAAVKLIDEGNTIPFISRSRKEATGYGSVYFAENMLKVRGKSMEGCTAAVSGSGNVAIYTIEKLYELGARPVTCSDSRGCIYQPGGINLEALKQVKEQERASLSRYAELCPDAR